MSLAYANEKLKNTIRDLATHPASLRERLIDAVVHNFYDLQAERDFPEELRERYRELHGRLTRDGITQQVMAQGGGRLHATVGNMSDDEVREVAQEILALAYEVEQYRDDPADRQGVLEDHR